MHRFQSLDVSLPTLSALLFPDEQTLTHQDSVGLYNGKDKSPRHQDGRIVLTSHRIVYVATSKPHINSCALDLATVRQTEFWGGLFKSSPKITLVVDDPSASSSSSAAPSTNGTSAEPGAERGVGDGAPTDKERDLQQLVHSAQSRAWVCHVCGMRNVPTSSRGLACSLCGVPADPAALAAGSSSSSASTPVSRLSTPPPLRPASAPVPPPPPPPPQLDPKVTGTRIACPVCTFLNHHSMTTCEVCDSALFPSSSASSAAPQADSTPSSSAAPTPRPSTPSNSTAAPEASYVRLSFRRGGGPAFYAALKDALAAKAWDLSAPAPAGAKGKKPAVGGGADEGKGSAGGGGGIDAILRGIDLNQQEREGEMDEALRDLESLMRKAKEMIAVAQSINQQLTSSTSPASSSSDAAAATLASSSLSSLGLVSTTGAVTADQIADKERYHAELAKELQGVLQRGRVLEDRGGIVGLDEVWCVWNRARGVALVSPSDLRSATSLLPTLPAASPSARIHQRRFPSGLTVLHTPRFAPSSFAARVLDALDLREAVAASLEAAQAEEAFFAGSGGEGDVGEREGVSVLEVAREEGISVGLAKELLELVELGERGRSAGGRIVRDEQGASGVRWFRNVMDEMPWDGQEF
ncbi:hypothetical protein JCM10207_002633 [Rhodosporidiobolus poonsookiae]